MKEKDTSTLSKIAGTLAIEGKQIKNEFATFYAILCEHIKLYGFFGLAIKFDELLSSLNEGKRVESNLEKTQPMKRSE